MGVASNRVMIKVFMVLVFMLYRVFNLRYEKINRIDKLINERMPSLN